MAEKNFFDKILPALGAIAPSIATALGGPLAGFGVSELAKAFGIEPQASDKESQIAQALAQMTPEQAVALHKADNDFAEHMRQMDIDLEEIARKDRDSARTMQTQTHDWTPMILGLAAVFGFFVLISLLAFVNVPVASHDAFMLLIGTLSVIVGSVYQFYFGSSKGSQNKDAILGDIAKA